MAFRHLLHQFSIILAKHISAIPILHYFKFNLTVFLGKNCASLIYVDKGNTKVFCNKQGTNTAHKKSISYYTFV